jgi:hypothetical protein
LHHPSDTDLIASQIGDERLLVHRSTVRNFFYFFSGGCMPPLKATAALVLSALYSTSFFAARASTLEPAGTSPPTASVTSLAGTTLKISGTPATSAEVGRFYSFTPTVVASRGSTLRYSIANKPAWAQFSASRGTLSGTPTSNSIGSDANIRLSVTNGSTSASLPTFSIAVIQPVVGTASLSWSPPTHNPDGSPLKDAAGYVIRYGSQLGALNTQISIGSANTTSAVIEKLTKGTWYFEIATINTAGVLSQFTSAVSAVI